MAVEIAALFGAAKVAAGLVKDAREIVERINTGRFANNEDAKRQLEEKIAEIQVSLRNVGGLANFGAEYAYRQKEVAGLLWETERVRGSLRENREAVSDSSHPRYADAWATAEQLFEGVREGQGPLFSALDDRIQWLDEKDKAQIQQRLQSAALAVEGAAQAVRLKASSDADMHLRRIIDELRHVQNTLNDTLRTGIFGRLAEIAQ